MVSPTLYRRAIPAAARVTRWTAPDGWTLRRFDWPAEGRTRGRMLFQGGRGDIFEKYLEAFAHWHAQGWAVTSFDWRGQGGSGRLSPDAHVGHVEDFRHYVDDFRAFWADWVAEGGGPHVALGHSMGGHLLLRALAEGAGRPDAAVLVAPMLGLHSPLGAMLGERLAGMLGGVGNAARPAWRGNERPATSETRQALLTHDLARYEDEIFWQSTRPELLLGPPSWRWLIEAFGSTRRLQADPRLRTLDVPVLLLVADNDKLVHPKAAMRVAAKLPDARVVRFGREAAHEILREADAVRNRALGEIDIFFSARAKGSGVRYDVAIVGAGMAGASLAAAIGRDAKVVLLEGEDVAGYHATGRSAAFWSETYGGPGVQPLTTASGAALRAGGFLADLGSLHLGREGDAAALDAFRTAFAGSGVTLREVDPRDYVPGLRADWSRGVLEPSSTYIDVAALHAHSLATAKREGATLVLRAPFRSAARTGGGWRIDTGAGTYTADILVDAAGAWADAVAAAAGVRPLGIAAYRRTVVQLATDPPAPAAMPHVTGISGGFYFKPEAGGRLWLSPHDETPVDPHDVQPEELDVAVAIDRFEQVVDWRVAQVERRWAGLRSFAPDRLPVYGFSADVPGFFWCAGQGGFGIQTAPAAAALRRRCCWAVRRMRAWRDRRGALCAGAVRLAERRRAN